jgi:hypothetical protein
MSNADKSRPGAWAKLSRLGYNVSRDEITMPAFLALLPEVSGLAGLDIGCGEGHGTRSACTPADLATTVFHLLGFPPNHRLATLRCSAIFPDGRILNGLSKA